MRDRVKALLKETQDQFSRFNNKVHWSSDENVERTYFRYITKIRLLKKLLKGVGKK